MRARFSPAEMTRRWRLARGLMEREDVDALLIFGNSGVNRHNEANVFWLTNHLDLHHCYLVAPRHIDRARALHGPGEPRPEREARKPGPDRRVGRLRPFFDGRRPAARDRPRTRAARPRGGERNVRDGYAAPAPRDAPRCAPELELIELTNAFASLRSIKSGEEIGWLRRAAAFTDRTIEALREQVRPGLPEYALLGIIEGSYRSDGGLPHIAFLRSMPMDEPNGCLPAQDLRPHDRDRRRHHHGDQRLVLGLLGQIHRPIFVGTEPTEPWQRMFDTAREAYDAMADAIRPGATEADVIRAGSVIGERGYDIYDDLIHGYGVDIHPPVIDRSCSRYWPWDDSAPAPEGRRFEANMAIVIQPNPITPDERMGLQLGALTIVTDGGAESLHEVPFEPVVAAARRPLGSDWWESACGVAGWLRPRNAPAVSTSSHVSRGMRARSEAAETFGCRAAGSLDALLDDSDVEAVLVVTPNHTHAEIAVAAAARGRHVFVEKPFADRLADGLRAVEAIQRAGVLLFVGHSFRRLGAARAAATAIAEGALGEIVLAEANFSLPGAFSPGSWRSRRETRRAGPMTQLGVHHVDTLQAWIGPAISVRGSMTHMAAAAEIDDVAVALLEHESGARSVISCSYVSPKTYRSGSTARRRTSTTGPRCPSGRRPNDGRSHDAHDRRRHGFGRPAVRAVRHAGGRAGGVRLGASRTGAAPETGAQEGLAALSVIEGVVETAASGGIRSIGERRENVPKIVPTSSMRSEADGPERAHGSSTASAFEG